MNKALLFIVVLVFSIVSTCSFGQNFNITAGDEIKIGKNNSAFNVLGFINDTLIMLEYQKGYRADRYRFHAFDKKSKFSLIKSAKTEFMGETDGGTPEIVLIKNIGNSVYVLYFIKDNTEKKYYGISYGLNLDVKTETTELFEVKLPENKNDISYWEYQFVWYNAIDSVFMISDSYYPSRAMFDLDFNAVEIVRDKSDSIDFESKLEKSVFSNYDYKGDKMLTVTIASKNKEFDHKPSSQSIYYSLESQTEYIKYGEGKIITLDENLYSRYVSCHYDSVADEIIALGFYNNFNRKKDKPAGIFFLKHSVKGDSLICSTFSNTTENFRKAYADSKIKKENKNYFNDERFNIIKKSDEGFFVVDCDAKTSSLPSENFTWDIKIAKVISGNIVFFNFDNKGILKSQSVISRYAEKEIAYMYTELDNYLAFTDSNNIYIVFSDNIGNYTNGVYNSKSKEDQSDDKTCLAVVKVDSEGNETRKVLINSVRNEYGVDLLGGGIQRVGVNEYIWFGYKDGVCKIVTIKLD
ncbi:MAG: hypothetical protein F9K23_17180 [Bacteroidetes bacterium]|nr:MAG: hypothetical protein F9K23_17180 [Bacteroidota bacterium]